MSTYIQFIELMVKEYHRLINHIDNFMEDKNKRLLQDLSKQRADFSFAYFKQISSQPITRRDQTLNTMLITFNDQNIAFMRKNISHDEYISYLIIFFKSFFDYIYEDYKKTGSAPILSDTVWGEGKRRKSRKSRKTNKRRKLNYFKTTKRYINY